MKELLLTVLILVILVSGSGCKVIISNRPPQTPGGATAYPAASLPVLPSLQPLPTATPTPVASPTAPDVDPPIEATPTEAQAVISASSASGDEGDSDPASSFITPKAEEAGYGLPAISARSTSPAAQAQATPTQFSPTRSVPPTGLPPIETRQIIPTPASAPAAVAPEMDASSACPPPIIYETTLSLNTYPYQSALTPSTPDDPVYPYARLNHNQIGPPAPQHYRVVVLENCYLQLTILPELGGRIYRWIDKASGQNLFYQNPVIKPTGWGHRGWWLATGGMEWALPVDEHGLSEASPWSYTLHQAGQAAGITLTDTEEHSGLISEVVINLDAGHSYFTLTPRLINPTGAQVSYKFWLNGMFGLGSQQPTSGIEFILPGSQVTIHSTGDATLPGENRPMTWPVFAGRTMSDYSTWTHYLGFFAAPAASAGYMGAYNHITQLGVARVFPHFVARGAKIFGPATLDPKLWTDDGSSYFELWGGIAPTFADTTILNPGEWITWQERWYAVANTGGFSFANEEAALKLKPGNTMVQVAAASTYPFNGQLLLQQNNREVARWPVSLAPGHSFQDNFIPPAPPAETGWALRLVDETGRVIAETGAPGAGATQLETGAVLPGAQPAALTAPPAPLIITATPLPDFTPAATITATPLISVTNGQTLWDPRLDTLDVKLQQAVAEPGQVVYRLVAARYQDEHEAKGLHHVFVEVVDENGQRLVGQPVVLAWKEGKSTMITEDKPVPEYAANAPLYGDKADGAYEVYVDGAPSDRVSGLGLPDKHHVSYLLTFQRALASEAEPTLVSPFSTTPTPTPSVTPSPTVVGGNNGSASTLWDPRLDQLGVRLVTAQPQPGQVVYRLVAARYQDEHEAKGLHHVFVEVVDENGQRLVGQPVILAWGDGKATLVTENKPIPEYAANAALYGSLPDASYRMYVDGAASDIIEGLGLPGKHHVSYLLTFQRKSN